jgi:replication-associated recombination protein RarA
VSAYPFLSVNSRLIIISYEDVSALVPGNIPTTISRMREDYFYLRSEGDNGALLVLSNAILLLCRSEKSRVADNFLLNLGFRIDEGHKLEIPDYALDMHTKRGKLMKRGGKHFVQHGSKLHPVSKTVKDQYKDGTEKRLSKDQVKVKTYAWANEKRKK